MKNQRVRFFIQQSKIKNGQSALAATLHCRLVHVSRNQRFHVLPLHHPLIPALAIDELADRNLAIQLQPDFTGGPTILYLSIDRIGLKMAARSFARKRQLKAAHED